METLFRPSHLIFILLIIIIIFGPEKLRELLNILGHWSSGLSGQWSNLRATLFMAKGVDASIGRDVGDMLPTEDSPYGPTWFLFLVAVILGNTFYFISVPSLPAPAQFANGSSERVPALVDFWFCVIAFVFLKLLILALKRNGPKK